MAYKKPKIKELTRLSNLAKTSNKAYALGVCSGDKVVAECVSSGLFKYY